MGLKQAQSAHLMHIVSLLANRIESATLSKNMLNTLMWLQSRIQIRDLGALGRNYMCLIH